MGRTVMVVAPARSGSMKSMGSRSFMGGVWGELDTFASFQFSVLMEEEGWDPKSQIMVLRRFFQKPLLSVGVGVA